MSPIHSLNSMEQYVPHILLLFDMICYNLQFQIVYLYYWLICFIHLCYNVTLHHGYYFETLIS